MSAVARLVLLAVLLGLGTGCAYTVRVDCTPAGARMTLPNGRKVRLPADVKLRHYPFARQEVKVVAEGYRTLELQLGGLGKRRRVVRVERFLLDPLLRPRVVFGDKPRAEVELLLVPVHEGSGTWTIEDVPGVD